MLKDKKTTKLAPFMVVATCLVNGHTASVGCWLIIACILK